MLQPFFQVQLITQIGVKMKLFFSFIIILAFIYSCSTQKETEKQKEDIPQPVVEKRKLDFSFEQLKSNSTASFRGVSVVDSLTIWISGSKGTILHTTDGGKNWIHSTVKGFEVLDYSDIEAFDKNSAIIMSVDAPAFFFKTTDGGKTWKRKYMNRDPKIFFDGLAFWNEKNGIAFSDPIDGKFFVVTTNDGGDTWKETPSKLIPAALPNEGGFAASGTSIAVAGKDLAWIGTGGSERARILFSQDLGENWRTVDAPMRNGNASRGIFSVCFKDDMYGVAVGGDYKDDKSNLGNCAISDDGGLTWIAVEKNQPNGFRSCVAWNEVYKYFLVTGTSGSDYSIDDGKTWTAINNLSFNSIGISKKDGSCFVVGDKGNISKVNVSIEK